MNEEIKRDWVAALESGDYRQGRSRLATIDTVAIDGGEPTEVISYCCLGVLCDLAVKSEVIDPPVRLSTDSLSMTFDGESFILPYSVVRWAGLLEDEDTGGTNPYVGHQRLSVHNDGMYYKGESGYVPPKPFAEIAALIKDSDL